jgi:excisionase family DNA binding protein
MEDIAHELSYARCWRHTRTTKKEIVMESLMRPDQLAEQLGIEVATIYRWRYRNFGPPAVKIGKYLRFRPSEVEAWLEQQQSQG